MPTHATDDSGAAMPLSQVQMMARAMLYPERRPPLDDRVPGPWRDLLQCCWSAEPARRHDSATLRRELRDRADVYAAF